MNLHRSAAIALILLAPGLPRSSQARQAPVAGSPAPSNVVELLQSHDRDLIRDLGSYLASHPAAEDRDQAYMLLLERVIENDWYVDHESVAREYLARQPAGPVAPLARIVATMARARSGKFDEALADYRALMSGIDQPDQEEFSLNFADSLASAALAAGDSDRAREVYRLLLERFGESPNLRQRVEAEMARIALVGSPAPELSARTVDGRTIRLSDLRGKPVLVDFWATWCTPCVNDLPKLLEVYRKYHDRGFEIVAVSLDDNSQAISDFVKARKVPWIQLHQASCEADMVGAFKVGSIPASYLIGPEGTIARINIEPEQLGPTLEKQLK